MAIYLAIILTTTLLSRCAFLLEKKSRFLASIAYAIVVVLYCYIAGDRHITVGSDTANYITAFHSIRAVSLEQVFIDSRFADWAIIIKLVMWFAANGSNSPFGFFFVLEFFATIPVLIACRKLLDSYMPYGIFVFSTLFYLMSFNMVRQSIAMGFVLLQYVYIRRRKLLVSCLILAIAVGFHTTAILGAVLYPLCFYADIQRLPTSAKAILLAIIVLVLVMFSRQILQFITTSTGLYENYTVWNSTANGGGLRTLLEIWGIFGLASLLSAVFIRPGDNVRRKEMAQLLIIVLLGAVLFSLCLISFWFYRIGLYYLYFLILLLPLLSQSIGDRGAKWLFISLISVVLLAFFFDYYVIALQHQVVPYVFAERLFHLI